jgi:predicted regulator of Ras-like GTPase activity (Roadblock/LC7/MglB family)
VPAEYREERLIRELREQIYENIEGVQEAVIVTNEGLVIAAYPSPNNGEQNGSASTDSGHWIAALAAEIIAQSRRAFHELAQGSVKRMLVEGESSSMIVIPAGDHAGLAVMVDANTKLGIAMFQMSRVAARIGDLLG